MPLLFLPSLGFALADRSRRRRATPLRGGWVVAGELPRNSRAEHAARGRRVGPGAWPAVKAKGPKRVGAAVRRVVPVVQRVAVHAAPLPAPAFLGLPRHQKRRARGGHGGALRQPRNGDIG